MAEVPHLRALVRGNVSSMAATAVDFVAYEGVLALAQFIHGAAHRFTLGVAVGAGAVLGAVTNFTVNRYWTFEARRKGGIAEQAGRYVLVSLLILVFNELGVHALVLGLRVSPSAAWVAVKIVAFLAISYPLQRYYVFASRRGAQC